jgi:hypothetical protein
VDVGSTGDVVMEHAGSATPDPDTYDHDLFIVYADADADFVRGYLLPALNLPPARVLLLSDN